MYSKYVKIVIEKVKTLKKILLKAVNCAILNILLLQKTVCPFGPSNYETNVWLSSGTGGIRPVDKLPVSGLHSKPWAMYHVD